MLLKKLSTGETIIGQLKMSLIFLKIIYLVKLTIWKNPSLERELLSKDKGTF